MKQQYKAIVEDILLLEKEKPPEYWRDREEIPLMSKKPFSHYGDEHMPEEDVLTVKIDTRDAQSRNPFNALVAASTGVGKTRLIKNLVKGFWKAGYKILYFEPKSIEMMNASKKGIGRRIHHMDNNEKLPISSYCPSYMKSFVEQNYPEMINKVKFFSPEIKNLNYREIWQSLNVPDKAADLIVNLINNKHYQLDYFIEKIRDPKNKFLSITVNASISSLNNIIGTDLFGYKKLPLEKEWAENNIVHIPFFSRDGAFMNTSIGLALDLVRDIGIKESRQGLQNITKKLIIFDDAFYYAGLSASFASKVGGVNLAIRNISNCQNNFRTWGVDTILVVQSPDSSSIVPSLIDGCTTKFVSYLENPTSLNGKIPYNAYRLLMSTKPGEPTLYIDEDNYIFQWIYVKGRTQWYTGFPFDCTVGHT